ncbi:hypothetical protein DFP72DRAFT_905758 [Ephemerocybe angulata]|uniref:Uncharacterized protein n=1 Tax=Ephemerocybe angulata TaxID=980116 RepID=A0A8H6HTA0_9AGAR|nr:hypothetical protein DFP72DRAFT_905758 [Tulosesus angulatus]
MSHYQSQSPLPLRRTFPTHPAYIPEPPSTPSSPQGFVVPVPAQPLPQHIQQQG